MLYNLNSVVDEILYIHVEAQAPNELIHLPSVGTQSSGMCVHVCSPLIIFC